jgi:hypothetical protein
MMGLKARRRWRGQRFDRIREVIAREEAKKAKGCDPDLTTYSYSGDYGYFTPVESRLNSIELANRIWNQGRGVDHGEEIDGAIAVQVDQVSQRHEGVASDDGGDAPRHAAPGEDERMRPGEDEGDTALEGAADELAAVERNDVGGNVDVVADGFHAPTVADDHNSGAGASASDGAEDSSLRSAGQDQDPDLVGLSHDDD